MSATDMPFEEHEELVAQLRAGTLDAPEHLHRRVLAAGPGTKRARVRMTRRRKLVLLVPVAAALAVGAALIHGAFNSGTPNMRAAAVPNLVDSHVVSSNAGTAVHGPAKKQTETLSALTQKSATSAGHGAYFGPSTNGAQLDAAGTAGSTPLAGRYAQDSAVTIPQGRLVHADAQLQVAVANHDALSAATNRASAIVTQLGGYAQSVQYQATRKGDGSAFLDLRVPVGKAQTAIGRLGQLGKLLSQQVSTQDLQQQFSKQTDTIGSLQRAIAIYEQALNSGSVTGSQRVETQIKLANAQHALRVTRKARSHTVASGATADIQLTLTTNQHGLVAPPADSGRLGRLLGNAAHFLALEGVIVLYALIVAGPIVLILALGWWLRRERRRRDERQLLAST